MEIYEKKTKISGVADEGELRRALNNVKVILKRDMIKYQTKYPTEYAEKMRYSFDKYFFDTWHGGCWCGMYWMMYEAFREMPFKRYAEEFCAKYYELINSQSIWHTDIGILFLPMCIPDMRFNRNKEAKEALVLAADSLLATLSKDCEIKTTFVRGNISNCKTSSLNNVLLLKHAERITGNPKYISASEKILGSVLEHNIEKDGRTFFEYSDGKKFDDTTFFDLEASDGYTRSQAWALLGLSNLYSGNKTKRIYETFFKCFDYLEEKTHGRSILKYCIGGSDTDYDDSTSTAITLCSILEFMKSLPESSPEYKKLLKAANRYMNGLLQCAAKPDDLTEGLLNNGFILHATHEERGVKTSATVSGDYFYVEALMRCLYNWQSYRD